MEAISEVHCRIGSLEMNPGGYARTSHVHCRIGSLEKSIN